MNEVAQYGISMLKRIALVALSSTVKAGVEVQPEAVPTDLWVSGPYNRSYQAFIDRCWEFYVEIIGERTTGNPVPRIGEPWPQSATKDQRDLARFLIDYCPRFEGVTGIAIDKTYGSVFTQHPFYFFSLAMMPVTKQEMADATFLDSPASIKFHI